MWFCQEGTTPLQHTIPPRNQQKCILPFVVFLPSRPSRCSIESLIIRMPISSVTLGPDPPWLHDMRLITIWPHLLSLSSTLFFYSSYTLTPVSLGHCMALDIMQTIKPEPHTLLLVNLFVIPWGPFSSIAVAHHYTRRDNISSGFHTSYHTLGWWGSKRH